MAILNLSLGVFLAVACVIAKGPWSG